jgi:hypothetical protein
MAHGEVEVFAWARREEHESSIVAPSIITATHY